MKTTARLAFAGGVGITGLAAATLLAAPAGATPTHSQPGSHGAVFVQNDATSGNAVIAYHRNDDGTLTRSGSFATGGLGGVLTGSVVDHLASQGSLTYDRRAGLLYAVNAGSDTITVFRVHGDRLERMQVLASGGAFPVSVTTHGLLVYVLNARDGGSIQGYLRLGDRLVRIPSWHRELGLDPALTPEFTSTPGQVSFTPDGRKLIVTTKNNGNQIDVFTIEPFGGPAANPVVTADPGNVPFAVAFDRSGRLQVAEAGPSAVATYAINPSGTLTLRGRTTTGQRATCWLTSSGDQLFLGNAGSGTVSSFRATASGPAAESVTATDPGTVDVAVSPDGRHVYAQTGAAGIVDEFAVGANGALTPLGSVTVPDAVGGQGIVAT
jgi:6-phosphogluconolactonase (cycloisomerase 2 family)